MLQKGKHFGAKQYENKKSLGSIANEFSSAAEHGCERKNTFAQCNEITTEILRTEECSMNKLWLSGGPCLDLDTGWICRLPVPSPAPPCSYQPRCPGQSVQMQPSAAQGSTAPRTWCCGHGVSIRWRIPRVGARVDFLVAPPPCSQSVSGCLLYRRGVRHTHSVPWMALRICYLLTAAINGMWSFSIGRTLTWVPVIVKLKFIDQKMFQSGILEF